MVIINGIKMVTDSYLADAKADIITFIKNKFPFVSKNSPFTTWALPNVKRYMLYNPEERKQPSYSRPLSSLAVSDDYGIERRLSLPVAMLSEIVQAFSLAVDDLPCMDDADNRRDKKATTKHFGQIIAILGSFGMREEAQEILYDLGVTDSTIVKMGRDMTQTAHAMLQGQVEDLYGKDYSLEAILKMHEGKTASLISFALRSGVYIAEELHESRRKYLPGFLRNGESFLEDYESLTRIGRAFGLWYQANDDILDIVIPPEEAGKDTKIDSNRNLVLAFSMDKAEGLRKRFLKDIEDGFRTHPRDLPILEGVVSGLVKSKNIEVPMSYR